ncbi:MAG: IS3 family transposase [Legionellales bacterium]|nr:IS3 family transposase [Legionellales bacterium]
MTVSEKRDSPLKGGAGNIKKGSKVLHQRAEIRYHFIEQEKMNHSIQLLCKVLKVSRSGYYAWQSREVSQRALSNADLLVKINDVFQQSRETYGYRSIHHELRKDAINCSKNRVLRLMKTAELKPKTLRKYKATTSSKHSLKVADNTLNRQFTVVNCSECWVSDITYIYTREGWLYLTVIIDIFSRKVIGWAMSPRLTSEAVCDAMMMALFRRRMKAPRYFHSDRGSQYCSIQFKNLLEKFNITASMSRKGNCWDNSVSESFFATLKKECVFHYSFLTREEARMAVFEYIEAFYNNFRRHSFLNYLSPNTFEIQAGIL